MLKAKCIQESDDSCKGWLDHDLEVGKEYDVDSISMGSSFTRVYLKDKLTGYNSIFFKFYENGKEIDIYSDKRYNPYL